jgi:AcrR family transcriptional regulator
MKTASHRGPGRPVNHEIRTRRQEEILDAAARLFAERGYSETKVQELADILRVGKGTVYRYFPTKEALFLATVDRLMQRLCEGIDRCIEAIEDPVDHIAGAVKTYLTFVAEHPEFAELLIQERAQFKDRKKPTYFVYHEAYSERRRDYLRQVIAEGRLREIPVDRIGDVIGDLLYGTMFTNYFTGRHRSPEEQAEDLLDVALFGILSDSERKRRGTEGPKTEK